MSRRGGTVVPGPSRPISDEQRLAWLRLIRTDGIGPITHRELINQFGGGIEAIAALPDLARRGYWLGAVLREANTRDVWLFTTAEEIRSMWPHILPHLGRARAMWAWLLGLDEPIWPPRQQSA